VSNGDDEFLPNISAPLILYHLLAKVREELKEGKVQEETLTRKEFEDKEVNLTCITAKLPGDEPLPGKHRRSISPDFM
jgi:hypothetical protein